jgi:hypothetical protein
LVAELSCCACAATPEGGTAAQEMEEKAAPANATARSAVSVKRIVFII